MENDYINHRHVLYLKELESLKKSEDRHYLRIKIVSPDEVVVGLDPQMRLNNVTDCTMKFVTCADSAFAKGSYRVSASVEYEDFKHQSDRNHSIADVVQENFRLFRNEVENYWCGPKNK